MAGRAAARALCFPAVGSTEDPPHLPSGGKTKAEGEGEIQLPSGGKLKEEAVLPNMDKQSMARFLLHRGWFHLGLTAKARALHSTGCHGGTRRLCSGIAVLVFDRAAAARCEHTTTCLVT
jgi:hypothetical protein